MHWPPIQSQLRPKPDRRQPKGTQGEPYLYYHARKITPKNTGFTISSWIHSLFAYYIMQIVPLSRQLLNCKENVNYGYVTSSTGRKQLTGARRRCSKCAVTRFVTALIVLCCSGMPKKDCKVITKISWGEVLVQKTWKLNKFLNKSRENNHSTITREQEQTSRRGWWKRTTGWRRFALEITNRKNQLPYRKASRSTTDVSDL